MILYFADRQMNILGQASTGLPKGLTVISDKKTDDIETGVSIFECKIPFDIGTRKQVAACTEVGNYILRSQGSDNEFYTIIETETDTKKQVVYIYAEDAGMDLLNEVVGAYSAPEAYPISHYINKYAAGSGFQIGINEAASLSRKLSWDGEATAAERLASVATQFDGCEISFSFKVDGLFVTKKYVNIYKRRGQDVGIQLRLNAEIDSITTTKSITNLATALQCTGGTPDDSETPITLQGYSYDDGDFYVDGQVLKSREALKRWSRLLWKNDGEGTQKAGGHITKQYSYDTLKQSTLCARAVTKLKQIRDMEINYDADVTELPDNVRVGDRVNIIDDAGELYLSTRLLVMETSVVERTHRAILGEHLIKGSGISQKIEELAWKFSQNSASAIRALSIANAANTAAEAAQTQAEAAAAEAAAAEAAASAASTTANTAAESAEAAQTAANAAQSAVFAVENSVGTLQTAVTNAQAAADNAHTAAQTAQAKAEEAATAAATAQGAASVAQTAAQAAQSTADSAVSNASAAIDTANAAQTAAMAASTTAKAAKSDSAQAVKDVESLADTLETVTTTIQTNYARKTELTETEAFLQSQIDRNSAQVESAVSMLMTVDETANDAADYAAQAQAAAVQAQAEASQATADAEAAQNAADEAKAAAVTAQSEADTAKSAADAAKMVADNAQKALIDAQAELEEVLANEQATQAEIQAAQDAVAAAQTAANTAQTAAETAVNEATAAQNVADAAVTSSNAAQISATQASLDASVALAMAEKASVHAVTAQNDAATAQTAANSAKTAAAAAAATAESAQDTADAARAAANSAKATADTAAQIAATAQKTAEDAQVLSAQAALDLQAAQARYDALLEDVDATQEELDAAQADVNVAQAAAEDAETAAMQAQATADAAAVDAATAQAAATEAKNTANTAQAAADAARAAADAAQGEVDGLAVRMTSAESKITQNARGITLSATKEEVAETLGGYYTKDETDAAIVVESNAIASTVKETYTEKNEFSERVTSAESKITQLASAISSLVTDENGSSLMTQTEGGWTFNISSLAGAIDDATEKIGELQGDSQEKETAISGLQNAVNSLGVLTEYIIITSYNGQPCIELGEADSGFKVRITNTEIQFIDGATIPANISNQILNIGKAKVEDELQFGNFAWKKRANGNMGLMWKGES